MIMLPDPVITTVLVYIFGIWMLFNSIMGICESSELPTQHIELLENKRIGV